jgi:hypothetical protein
MISIAVFLGDDWFPLLSAELLFSLGGIMYKLATQQSATTPRAA